MPSIDLQLDESSDSIVFANRPLASPATRVSHLVHRRELLRRLHQILESSRELGSVHAIAFIDIDCPVGAADLRRRIIRSMCQRIRSSDTLAELEVDRYALILHHCPQNQALSVAGALLASIRSTADRATSTGLTSSTPRAVIGLVPFTAEPRDTDELIERGRRTCAEAWLLGGDRVQVFRSAASDGALKQYEILRAAGLQRAIEHNQLRLYGQDIVPLKPDLPRYVEVLLRIPDGHGGDIPPAAFVLAAERHGLATRLDLWVVEAALASYRRLFGDTSIGLSINLSGHTVGDPELPDLVRRRLTEYGVPAERVCFEITETAAINDLDRARDFIDALRRLGCRFALDDFGSGHASFRYLKALDVDYLKIDRGFVRDILGSEFDLAMIEAIQKIGDVLGIHVVAEGVESREIRDRLYDVGVDYAQGFIHGKPCALEELTTILPKT